jgi:hypothetical protein
MAAVEKGPAANDDIAASRALAKGADAFGGARALDCLEHRIHALEGLHRHMQVPVHPATRRRSAHEAEQYLMPVLFVCCHSSGDHFLLRDWDRDNEALHALVPKHWRACACRH